MTNEIKKRILKKGFLSVCLKACYIVIQFFVGVSLARVLGPSEFGAYSFVVSFSQILVVLAQFGLPSYLLRYISVGAEQNEKDGVNKIITSSFKIIIFNSLCIYSCSLCLFYLLDFRLGGVDVDLYLIGFLLIPVVALSQTISFCIRGYGSVLAGQIPDEIARSGMMFFIVLIFLTFSIGVTAKEAILIIVFSSAFGLGVGFIILNKIGWFYSCQNKEDKTFSAILKLSFPYFSLSISQIINNQVDVLMLGILSNSTSVGHYRVSMQFADGLGVFVFAISLIVGPSLAKYYAKNDLVSFKETLVNSHRFAACLLFPFVAAVFLFSEDILAIVFGDIYKQSSLDLKILVAGKFIYSMMAFSGLALSMMGKPWVATLIGFFSMAVNGVMCLILIPSYGTLGAAISSVTGLVIISYLGVYYINKIGGFNISAIGHKG